MSEAKSDVVEVEFSLKVMVNKEKTKVLFAEADSHFTDILLSFLTLPLGRIVKVLEKHYGDEAPSIGSVSSLYLSLGNLDSSLFWTEGARNTLFNPRSSSEDEYRQLKLDIADSPPAEYFKCSISHYGYVRFRSVYYDNAVCGICVNYLKKVAEEGSEAASRDGAYTIPTASFVISDDLQILPYETGLMGIISTLGLTDADKMEPMKVTFGLKEIVNLLKASLTSQTPLSDLILNKTRQANSVIVESELGTPLNQIENEEDPNSKKMVLKVMVQISSGKVVYAQAEEDFVDFLLSFLHIPMGGVEQLVGGKTGMKAIDSLYRSTIDHIGDKYFKTRATKERLMKPNLPHGCISKDHILPLTEEPLPANYRDNLSSISSLKFPKGQGSYLKGPQFYHVTDDLTVTPFCVTSILSGLGKKEIPLSDLKEVEMQIGLKEGLSILKASLTSTSALSDALLSPTPTKQRPPKYHYRVSATVLELLLKDDDHRSTTKEKCLEFLLRFLNCSFF